MKFYFLCLLYLIVVIACVYICMLKDNNINSNILGASENVDITNSYNRTENIDELLWSEWNKMDKSNLPNFIDEAIIEYKLSKQKDGGAINSNTSKLYHTDTQYKWMDYNTWNDLKKDKEQFHNYLQFRRRNILAPDFIWDKFMEEIKPYMKMNREYIGIINVKNDGKTLYLAKIQASPTIIKIASKSSTAGKVPAYLVEKMAMTPGVFFFHTHPIKDGLFQLPSSADIVSAIGRSSMAFYVGDALVSEFGAFVYGIDYTTIETLKSCKDFHLSLLHYTLDLASAMESIRSWVKHNCDDILNMLRKYGMYIFPYTNEHYVKDVRYHVYIQSTEFPSDLSVLYQCIKDIDDYKMSIKIR